MKQEFENIFPKEIGFRKGLTLILKTLVEERVKFLSLLQTIDEECSFPMTEEQIKKKAILELISERKIPPFYERLE